MPRRGDEKIEDNGHLVDQLVKAEMMLTRLEKDKAESTKGYSDQIKACKVMIAKTVRKLNGEDPQEEIDLDD